MSISDLDYEWRESPHRGLLKISGETGTGEEGETVYYIQRDSAGHTIDSMHRYNEFDDLRKFVLENLETLKAVVAGLPVILLLADPVIAGRSFGDYIDERIKSLKFPTKYRRAPKRPGVIQDRRAEFEAWLNGLLDIYYVEIPRRCSSFTQEAKEAVAEHIRVAQAEIELFIFPAKAIRTANPLPPAFVSEVQPTDSTAAPTLPPAPAPAPTLPPAAAAAAAPAPAPAPNPYNLSATALVKKKKFDQERAHTNLMKEARDDAGKYVVNHHQIKGRPLINPQEVGVLVEVSDPEQVVAVLWKGDPEERDDMVFRESSVPYVLVEQPSWRLQDAIGRAGGWLSREPNDQAWRRGSDDLEISYEIVSVPVLIDAWRQGHPGRLLNVPRAADKYGEGWSVYSVSLPHGAEITPLLRQVFNLQLSASAPAPAPAAATAAGSAATAALAGGAKQRKSKRRKTQKRKSKKKKSKTKKRRRRRSKGRR